MAPRIVYETFLLFSGISEKTDQAELKTDMQILITAIGSSGDVNPFMVIGARLKEMGHSVSVITNPVFEEKVKRAGLELLPLGTLADYERAVSNPDLWKINTAFKAVWKEMPASLRLTYEIIESVHQGENTIMIGSTLALGARLAQEKFNLPLATVHLAPTCILSKYNTPVSPTHPLPPWLPIPLKSAFFSILDAIWLDRICIDEFNQIRKSLGLGPTKNLMRRYIHSPDLVIGAFPDWFASVQPDWPPNSYTTGFPLYSADEDHPLPTELESFLSSGDPPLVFTAGSAMAFSKDFFERSVQASLKAGMRAVLVSQFADQIPKQLPPGVIHVPYANFNALFSRAAAATNHGGIGTSAMALASGCPQIISPYAHDQFDNGYRMQALGVGKCIQSEKPDDWVKTIKEVCLDSIKARCNFFQKKISSEKAAAVQISELILSKLGRIPERHM